MSGAAVVVIDLRPADEARAARSARRQRLLVHAAAALLAIVVLLGHLVLERSAATTRRVTIAVDAELATLRRPAAALRRLRARQVKLKRRLAVIDGLEARGRTVLRALDAVSGAVPPGSWLTELALADGRLRIAGMAGDDGLIVAFVAALRASPVLHAVDLEEAGAAGGEPAPGGRRFVVAGTLGADA